MRLGDLAGMASGNLWRQKLRTSLTVLGVSVGVSALVLMVSLGVGIKRMILKQMDSTNLLTEIAVTPIQLDLGAVFRGGKLDRPPAHKAITRETLEALRVIPGVRAAYPNLNLWVQIAVDDQHSAGELYGLPPEGVVDSLREAVVAGRTFQPAAREVMISDAMAKDLTPADPKGKDAPPANSEAQEPPPVDPARWIGRTLKITGARERNRRPRKISAKDGGETYEFTIVGVYSSATYKSLGPRIYVPLEEAERVRAASMDKEYLEENPRALDEFPAATVRIDDPMNLDAVTQEIKKLGYGTLTIQDVIDMVENVFLAVEALLGCVGGVGLLVAFFGIANTMLMSILERTREIGIMKAVGGTRWDIANIFLVEASAIGFLGGALGIGGGWLLGKVGNWIATLFAKSRGMERVLEPFDVSLWLGAGAMVFAVLVSVVAGLYPAWRAARLDPVVALRHE